MIEINDRIMRYCLMQESGLSLKIYPCWFEFQSPNLPNQICVHAYYVLAKISNCQFLNLIRQQFLLSPFLITGIQTLTPNQVNVPITVNIGIFSYWR